MPRHDPSSISPLSFRRLDEHWTEALVSFFEALIQAGDDRHFHPHPFTPEAAAQITHYAGRDFYGALFDETQQMLGYGMLRGWDAGYAIPSLGIAIHSQFRGRGLGRLLMNHLHDTARRLGAARVRLKVHADNRPAIALYRNLGYVFDSQEAGQLVGVVDLDVPRSGGSV